MIFRKIYTRIQDWLHGWSEPSLHEREAHAIIETLVQVLDDGKDNRDHNYDKDCWCDLCLRDHSIAWMNKYWVRRLKRSPMCVVYNNLRSKYMIALKDSEVYEKKTTET